MACTLCLQKFQLGVFIKHDSVVNLTLSRKYCEVVKDIEQAVRRLSYMSVRPQINSQTPLFAMAITHQFSIMFYGINQVYGFIRKFAKVKRTSL